MHTAIAILFPGHTLAPIASAPSGTALLVARLPRVELAWRDVLGRWWMGCPERATGLRLAYEPTHWMQPLL